VGALPGLRPAAACPAGRHRAPAGTAPRGNLSRADLGGANLSYASLARANVDGANLTGVIGWPPPPGADKSWLSLLTIPCHCRDARGWVKLGVRRPLALLVSTGRTYRRVLAPPL
jgi:hypothetical protein